MTSEKRRRTLEKIENKYPNVKEAVGYIPDWVFFFEGYPILSKTVMGLAGAASGVLLMLLILLR